MAQLNVGISTTGYSHQDKVLWTDMYWMTAKEAEAYLNEILKEDGAQIIGPDLIKFPTVTGYVKTAFYCTLTR